MRITYPALETIKKIEHDSQYIRQAHIVQDYNAHLHKKHRAETQWWIDLYTEQGDLKRYNNSHTIDVFV